MKKIGSVLIILIVFLVTGCGYNYKSSVTQYNATIEQAEISLINYYNSLYKLNRILYFQDKLINSDKKIALVNLQDPDKEPHLAIEFSELNLRIDAIKALGLYSEYLVRIYNDDLKKLTLDSVNSMANEVINYTDKNNHYISAKQSAIASTTTKIVDIAIEKKRYELLKKYVNLTNPKIEKYLNLLEDDTVKIVQKNAEFEVKQVLVTNINDYNRYLISENSFSKFNNPKEILRQNQINIIKYDYDLYLTVQKNNPQKVITGLQTAQKELVECVNNPKKSPTKLADTLKQIHEDLTMINNFLP